MANKRRLIVKEQPLSPISEAFRMLRTNIQLSKADDELRSIMFTSSGPTEGKSTIIANVAISIAQTGKQVIILDCDLRKPVQHKIFCLQNTGLSNALLEGVPVDSLIQKTYINNLNVVPSGPTPASPSEVLGPKSIRKVIDSLKDHCDVVLLDAPPVLAVTDALNIAAQAEGVILVVNSGANRPEVVLQAKELLLKAKANIIGTVLNRAELEDNHAFYNYYYSVESKVAK